MAARKVALLLRAGGEVEIVAPELGPTLSRLIASGEEKICYRNRCFETSDLEGCLLVIAATNDPDVNREVSRLAQDRRMMVNVVDQPKLCNFVVPSLIERSPVQIAVSTGGASPVLARILRSRLETLIPAAFGQLAALVEEFRESVKKRFQPSVRRLFWEQVLQGPVAESLFAGQEQTARALLEKAIETETIEKLSQGEVYLVGAGPGDPDLLTFRALRLMQQADVVLYDRLVAPAILDLTRRDAERIYVGKAQANHTLPQEEINALLIRLAKMGKRILRLKGGDPFIFGRGGEEIEPLMGEGIPFQIVPGVTAASGCSAYAGIPLTHRDYAQSCIFVTGHLKDGSLNLNWQAIIQPHQTVVFYMGLSSLDSLVHGLIQHGMSQDTPIALISHGTTPKQRVLIGTLATIVDQKNATPLDAPTLVIVGHVVKLHERLAWFAPVSSSSFSPITIS